MRTRESAKPARRWRPLPRLTPADIQQAVSSGIVQASLTERTLAATEGLSDLLVAVQRALNEYRRQGKPPEGKEAFREPWDATRRYLRTTAHLPLDPDDLERALNASLGGLVTLREARRTAWRECQHSPRCDTIPWAPGLDMVTSENSEIRAANEHIWRILSVLRDWRTRPVGDLATVPGPPDYEIPPCGEGKLATHLTDLF